MKHAVILVTTRAGHLENILVFLRSDSWFVSRVSRYFHSSALRTVADNDDGLITERNASVTT